MKIELKKIDFFEKKHILGALRTIFFLVRFGGMSGNELLSNRITEELRNFGLRHDTDANNALFELVYDELRRQARRYLKKEHVGHTLLTTDLVHEAYLKLAKQKNASWENRQHFFSIAAIVMRRILIDYAKSKHRIRRGGPNENVPLENVPTIGISGDMDLDLLALDEALNRLAEKDTHLAKVVELRFFSGLDVPQTAEVLGVSESTIKRDWAMAKAWLHRELTR